MDITDTNLKAKDVITHPYMDFNFQLNHIEVEAWMSKENYGYGYLSTIQS